MCVTCSGDDLDRGAEASGVSFRPVFSDQQVRAKSGAIEVTYHVSADADGTVDISIIKSAGDNGDMSGLDTTAAETKITLSNGVELGSKADGDVIYSAWFGAESEYYTIYDSMGMTSAEVESSYNSIVDAEAAGTSFHAETAEG